MRVTVTGAGGLIGIVNLTLWFSELNFELNVNCEMLSVIRIYQKQFILDNIYLMKVIFVTYTNCNN